VTRRSSPRVAAYAALAGLGLLLALALGRADLAVLAAPFAAFAALAAASPARPSTEVTFSLSSDRVTEGAQLEAVLTLHSAEGVERLDLAVAIPERLAPEPAAHALALHLAAGERRELRFALRAGRWGAYEAGECRVRAHDALGVTSFEATAAAAVALRVYPEVQRLRRLVAPLRTQPFAGSQVARAKGEGIEFADIRAFQFGDQVRRINWRASARRAELLVTESNPERTGDVVLLLDGYADVRRADTGTLDELVRVAASLARAHLAQRDRVGVITFGTEVTWLVPSNGERQGYQIVESLIETAVVRSYRWHNVSLLPSRTLPPGALVLAVSPLTDRRTMRALLDLRARSFDVAVLAISPLAYLAEPRDAPEALARRLWLLARRAMELEYERVGIPVAALEHAGSLAAAVEEVRTSRRYARRARA
jgi:uncharacterized protein (DUF58 family)